MAVKDHKYIKLLDYVMLQKKHSYHLTPGLESANMTDSEFELVRDSLFINANMQAPPPGRSQVYEWRLRPETVFGYLAYKQYEHAQKSSRLAFYISSASLTVAVLALIFSRLSSLG